MAETGLTATDLLAAASSRLERGGYTRVDDSKIEAWRIVGARLYEDAYSVVALIVYETWSELESSWTAAQANLAELMSAHMTRADPKSWEGYLVVLTPGTTPGDAVESIASIRYDISRVRKLVATGDDLKQISDVERTLLPLLPLETPPAATGGGSVLELVPGILSAQGIEQGAVEAVIEAFVSQRPLVESLHEHRSRL